MIIDDYVFFVGLVFVVGGVVVLFGGVWDINFRLLEMEFFLVEILWFRGCRWVFGDIFGGFKKGIGNII